MENRDLFAFIVARAMSEIVFMGAQKQFIEKQIEKQKEKREELLKKNKQATGKYDRNLIEFTLYKHNKEIDDWLNNLLIDYALEKKDRAAFEKLTAPPLEGW